MKTLFKTELFFFLIVAINGFSEKFITVPICLNKFSADSTFKITCENANSRLFVTLKQYTNDLTNSCGESSLNNNETTISSKCFAYPTHELAEECNGKNECLVKLDRPVFRYGFKGSLCNFQAEILTISYECIPVELKDASIPKYDICSNKIIDHPVFGFLHSPNYPKSYPSNKYCQITIKIDDSIDRLEIFLIDMELEALSKRTALPTDFLQLNNREHLFGIKKHLMIFNESSDAVLKFKTDTFFNKRGFLIYFKTVKKIIEEIELEEEELEVIETTSTTTTTTTTTQTIILTTLLNEAINTTFNYTLNQTSLKPDENIAGTIEFSKLSIQREEKSTAANIAEISTRTLLVLLAIILTLATIILFLVFTNRKKTSSDEYSNKSIQFQDLSRVQISNETKESDVHSRAVVSTNSIGFIKFNATNEAVQSYRLNLQPAGTSDDSLAHLLLNNSTYSEPVNLFIPFKPSAFSQEEGKKNMSEENDYAVNPIERDTLKSKVNEYCYIPSSLIIVESDNEIQMKCENLLNSTPCLPKTLPPSKNSDNLDGVNMSSLSQELNVYEVPSKIASPNEYTICIEELDDVPELNDVYEYQIPSNIPTLKKNSNLIL